MTPSCLIVAWDTLCHAAARMPRALAHAGFDVALLAPRDSLAEKSRHVGRVGHLPADATAGQWLFAFAAMAKAVAPAIALPADDIAYNLMQAVVTTPTPGMQPAMQSMLSSLVGRSLGNPAHYRTCVDGRAVARIAADLGIDAATIVDAGPDAAARRMQRDAWGTDVEREAVPVDSVTYTLAAWEGTLLAGWAGRAPGDVMPGGVAAVVRRYRDPRARDAAARLVDALGMSGLLEVVFAREGSAANGGFVDVRRALPRTAHSGAKLGVDLCAALHAALVGVRLSTRADLDAGAAHDHVRFPDEWLRDPDSRWLRTHPVDIPWDEPELFEALLALGPDGP
jgi:hypothetical protein